MSPFNRQLEPSHSRMKRASIYLVRDSSAFRRLFVRLAGAVGRQSALDKENIGCVAPNTGPCHYPRKYTIDNIPYIVTVCVFVRHLFSWYPFYFDFHSARIIFDVFSGFYLWNINNTKADICKKL